MRGKMPYWIYIMSFIFTGCMSMVPSSDRPPLHTLEIVSTLLTIDRIYRSMEGPAAEQFVSLGNVSSGEQQNDLIWLTGIRTEILGAEDDEPQPEEYLCHVTFAFNKKVYNPAEPIKYRYPKLLALIQGQPEMRFPENFGMPVLSSDSFLAASMVLNNNEVPQSPFRVKVKNTLEYFYDEELSFPMKPLFRRSYILKVPVQPESAPTAPHCDFEEGMVKGPLEQKTAEAALGSLSWQEKDREGNILSIHWMVPPGRHIYRYRLPADELDLPFDTTAHYMVIHLHPFGQYMVIRDLTAGKDVYKGYVKNYRNRRGIAYAGRYSSEKGIRFYKDHEYELICEYNNPTAEKVDAMAMMLVFYLDSSFDKTKFNESVRKEIYLR